MKIFFIKFLWFFNIGIGSLISCTQIIDKQNIAFAIFAGLIFSTFLVINYDMWKRGNTNSIIFGDITEIEKDLRKIQELEIKQKLKELKIKRLGVK
jgi:hypothetical protein